MIESKTLIIFQTQHAKNYRKQAVKVKGFEGILKSITSGMLQGSILGLILFNIFINDLFYFIKGSNLHNFADDNTLSDNANRTEELIIKLEGLSDNAIDWMDNNYMIANPAKFHAILLTKSRSNTAGKTLKIKNNLIQSESKVELLGLTIDNRLSFHSHISSICKKAAKQLNAVTQKIGKFFKFYSMKGTCTIICLGKLQLLSNHMVFLFCKRPAQNGKGSGTYTSVYLC